MPINDAGNASGPAVSGPTLLLPGDLVTLPMPIVTLPAMPGGSDGGVTRIRLITGTEGDDVLTLDGGVALGGDGADTFVLTSNPVDGAEGPENLGTIMDFQDGDKLDLSKLGDSASILGREAGAKGGERVSIDFDGDGKEDGYVLVHTRGEIAPDDGGVITPGDGEFHILPFPLPVDGVLPIGGEVTILPFPMPGDGEFTILPFQPAGDGATLSSVEIDSSVAGEAIALGAVNFMVTSWIV